MHADYACRHSGACCTAGWPIPIDDDLRRALDDAGKGGRLATGAARSTTLETAPCQFFDSSSRLCAIHRDLGAEYKPPSCRHFPRVALLDARGVSLTLSHFCPTAASLLFRDDVPLAIVESPAAFPAADDYEGLDARSVLPPLLRPGMLWDLDGYSAWEEQAVCFLDARGLHPELALKRLRRIAARIEEWSPGRGTLRAHVCRAFEIVAHPVSPADEPDTWLHGWARVVNRYLAARLFASWVPYRSDRLSALVDDLESTLALLKENASGVEILEAIRQTDLRVVHGIS
jgi:Fe-S-cluster containining protein